MEVDRAIFYNSKIDVANDLDNSSDLQHAVCKKNNLGHSSDQELGRTENERSRLDCFAFNTSRRMFYAIIWDDIGEETLEGDFLSSLRDFVAAGNT